MAGRKKPPKYDNNGNQLRCKQFKMNHTRTQSSDDGASIVCHISASIVNRTHHSYAIIGPFIDSNLIAVGIKAASKRWVSLYEGTAFGIVPVWSTHPISFLRLPHCFAHKIETETVVREPLVRLCCILTLDLIKINFFPIAHTLHFAH